MTEKLPMVMTFAATDPSGGAGMQADLFSIASMGCHPLSVVTAVTVQDTSGVDDVVAIEADCVEDQARAVLEDIPVDAFKIGVLGNVDNVTVVAEILSDYPQIPVVFDPVLASGRGDTLATEEMLEAMRELLLPQSLIMTPNSIEAKRLVMDEDQDDQEWTLAQCAEHLVKMGGQYILITGAHEQTSQVKNVLYDQNGIVRTDQWARLPHIYHGSGCTLSSSLAALLAQALSVEEAVLEAQEFTWQTLNSGFRAGMGQYIPDRLFWARGDDDDNPASQGSN